MTSAEERLEERLRSGLREVAESVTFVDGTGFVPAAPPTTTPSWRRHRTLFLATACVSLVLVVGVVAVIRSAQPARNVTVNPTTGPNGQPSVAPSPSGTGARTAAATVPYVKGLVSTGRLPHASAVRRVWADGAIIVLSTTLTDHAAAEDLYERLSTAAGCDDSYLLVKGYRVVLQDGSQVTAPRRGYKTCAGT